MRAGTLHLHLSEFPGLMQAERVLITATDCQLQIPGNQVAYKHLMLRNCKRLHAVAANGAAWAAGCGCLTITWKRPMDPKRWFAANALARTRMLAAGKKVYTTRCGTLWQPEGKKDPWSFYRGTAIVGVRYGSMESGEQGHAGRCCCHACLACLHRDGIADFPEAVAEEDALFGA